MCRRAGGSALTSVCAFGGPSFESAGGSGAAPQIVQGALHGVMAVLTWEPPEASALRVVACVIERAVGKGAQGRRLQGQTAETAKARRLA